MSISKLKPKWSRYIPTLNPDGTPRVPTVKQYAALLLADIPECFFGGAAGGGKSDWLLMSALQNFDQPGYNGLILRRTFTQLNAADSILTRAHEWLRGTPAQWKARHKRFESPEGGTLSFGYMQHDKDVYNYDSAAYHFVGFDELTQFTEWQYTFMFGRIRRKKVAASQIPLRMCSASNPGALWVKQRFVLAKEPDRVFIPAKLQDNPYIDAASYIKSLQNLDPITRAQRLDGDWDADLEGALFKRSWPLEFVDEVDLKEYSLVRYWDFASTANAGDFTSGVLLGRHKVSKRFAIIDIVRGQWSPAKCDEKVLQTKKTDGPRVKIRYDQDPGAAGKHFVAHLSRLLAGSDLKSYPKTKSKMEMWTPFASQVESGNVMIVRGAWNSGFLQELYAVPHSKNDDQIDATAGAFATHIAEGPGLVGMSRV